MTSDILEMKMLSTFVQKTNHQLGDSVLRSAAGESTTWLFARSISSVPRFTAEHVGISCRNQNSGLAKKKMSK